MQSGNSNPRRVFKLSLKGAEELKVSWYPEEVQEIEKNGSMIEKVIRKRRTNKAVQEGLDKCKDLPPNFKTWIPATELESVK